LISEIIRDFGPEDGEDLASILRVYVLNFWVAEKQHKDAQQRDHPLMQ
jgi:hypothetical protein